MKFLCWLLWRGTKRLCLPFVAVALVLLLPFVWLAVELTEAYEIFERENRCKTFKDKK